MLKFKGIYSILIGACMIILWCMLLFTDQVNELTVEPYRIIAHLLSEFITAVMLIAGGIIIIRSKKDNILSNIALGALLYSVLTAGGYYLQKGDVVMILMFSIFTLITAFFIFDSVLIKHSR